MTRPLAGAGAPTPPRRQGSPLAGFTPKGFGLILLICVVNALRRKAMYRPGIDQSVADWMLSFVEMVGLGLMVAIPVALAVVFTCNRLAPSSRRRYPVLVAVAVGASLAGVLLMLFVEHHLVGPVSQPDGSPVPWNEILTGYWLRYALLAALLTVVYAYARTAEESMAGARAAELDRQRHEQQMDEARLQVLQAQIEPHFLFNTLATVRRLYHTTPQAAVATLDNLMRYLSVALPQMRAEASTLGREVDLASAYLAVQKLRMGRRLNYAIDVPDALREAPMPPMMLLTLVENAIKHGLSPLPEGGFVRISAEADRGVLRVRVADSGGGFVRSSGGGTGLANLRARLSALRGEPGRLELALNEPRGIAATITLPHAAARAAAARP
jgi:sensor histidine kinase YesM